GALPRVAIEGFAKGTPVVAARHGAMADVIDDGCNGLRFEPGNSEDLAAKVSCLISDSSALKRMRRGARATFERNFTADANHEALMAIYARAADETFRHDSHDTVVASPWSDAPKLQRARDAHNDATRDL
ncbi:MAG TPA: glycosyltransferase, partial [Candidatus Acidoferrales bacterium]|nr:glycosyltransferase [Candidatus Acidoferrales bacterium]